VAASASRQRLKLQPQRFRGELNKRSIDRQAAWNSRMKVGLHTCASVKPTDAIKSFRLISSMNR